MMDTHQGLIAWFARNHVAANLLMFMIIGCGLLSAFSIRTILMPDMESQSVTINVPFPGASPGEVESGVLLRVEEAVRDIEGIDRMSSNANQGSGSVRLSIDNGYDVQVILDEVNMAMNQISGIPNQTERFSVARSYRQQDAISIQITGDLSERSMKSMAEQIRNEVLALPSVTKADLSGARNYEISIELEESKLRQFDLTLESVARAIRNSSLDLPAGSINTEAGDIMLRTQGQAYSQSDFESLVLRTDGDGSRLNLGDIAVVEDGFVDQAFFSFFNGKPSIGVSVYAVSDQNQIQISKEIRDFVERRAATLPDSVELKTWHDRSRFLNSTLKIMLSNLLYGVILVMIALGLFLRIQLAFWVMLGMPIAFLGAFALMPSVGQSINLFSLFGFILVLGIVVDDAIVIGESVQTHAEQDGHNIDNVIIGARRVAIPATFGVLTTIAAFGPLLFVPGSFGVIPASIGWVVLLCLAFSIVESKIILPAHLARMKPLEDAQSPLRKFQVFLAGRLNNFKNNYYQPLLETAIRQRYITAAIFVGMLLLAIGFVVGPYMRTVIFPSIPGDFIDARVELVDGSSPAHVVRIVKNISDSLIELNESKPESERFLTNISASTSGTSGRIAATLIAGSNINSEAIANEWRALVGGLAGVKEMRIEGSRSSSGSNSDVGFSLLGSDPEELQAAAEFLEETLQGYAGTYEITSSAQGSIPEVNLAIKPSAEALGLTLNDLASQVRAAFFGIEAQRIQRGSEEVRVMVRYPKQARKSLGNLENMYIHTADGDEVPFSAVADTEERMSPASIYREWGKRNVSISAAVDKALTEPGDIVHEITRGDFPSKLKERFPSVEINLGGASQMEIDLRERLKITAALGLFVIYALMAIPLKSYTQPLIIMGVIPFGMIGAMIGHLVVGIPFSALSLFGIIALAGVVVNDSLILVDFVNKSVAEGNEITEAAKQAGLARFRAILLTSLTTFFGLLPILMETSFTAQIVLPMAISLGFGILFATVITLILIPCLYIILDDLNLSKFSTGHTHQSA